MASQLRKSESLMLLLLGTSFAAEIVWIAAKGHVPPAWFILPLGFAAYRGGRAVSYNLICKWLRHAIGIVEVEDSSKAGNSVEVPETLRGPRRILAELICCPICSGTWIVMGILGVYGLSTEIGTILMYALAAGGVGEAIHWWSEAQEWSGRNQRELAGSQWLAKDKEQRREARIAREQKQDSLFTEEMQKTLQATLEQDFTPTALRQREGAETE